MQEKLEKHIFVCMYNFSDYQIQIPVGIMHKIVITSQLTAFSIPKAFTNVSPAHIITCLTEPKAPLIEV